MDGEKIDTSSTSSKINNLLAALIITISFIVMGLSGSYAFFLNRVEDKNTPEQKSLTVNSGELTMEFKTTDGRYINVTKADLIENKDVLNQGEQNFTEFTISLPEDASVDSAVYDLYLTDIEMTENFVESKPDLATEKVSKDIKWALFDVTNGNPESLASAKATGDFENVKLGDEVGTTVTAGKKAINTIELFGEGFKTLTIAKGHSTKYRLYIWLSNDPNHNQVGLLNGSLSARVGFSARTNSSAS